MFQRKITPQTLNILFLEQREKEIRNNMWPLGPSDCIIVKKTFVSSQKVETFSYFIEGLDLSSLASFPAYFAEYIQKQINITSHLIPDNCGYVFTQKAKLYSSNIRARRFSFGNGNTITEGIYCCWNFFSNVDIRITVSIPGSCKIDYFSPNCDTFEVNDFLWNEIRISNALRFYRGKVKLFGNLFGIDCFSAPCLNFNVPKPLTVDDFHYVLKHAKPSLELEYSILHSLISLKDPDVFFDLLTKFSLRMPHVLSQLLFFCPQPSKILRRKLRSIVDSIRPKLVNEDIFFVFSLVDFETKTIENINYQKLFEYIPYLRSALWSDPLAGIAMAKILIAIGKPEDSIPFLNASFYSLKSMTKFHESKIRIFHHQKINVKYSIEQMKEELIKYPFAPPSFPFYQTLATAIRNIGVDVFKTCYLSRFVPSKIDSFSIPPAFYPNFEEKESQLDENDKFDDLYDPGAVALPSPYPIIEDLPICSDFYEIMKIVVDDLNAIEVMKRELDESCDHLRHSLFALRVNDLDFASKCLWKMGSKTPFADLVRMRILKEIGFKTFEEHLHSEPSKGTLDERNSIIIAKEIFRGLILIKKSLENDSETKL